MNLELNCANIIDEGKGIVIPPKTEHAKKYPTKIGVRALKEYIAKGGEVLTIPIEKDQSKEIIKKEKIEEETRG